MIIFPAIDIKNGRVVRLLQGEFDKVTEYAHDPISVALKWQGAGAQWIHLVDLDGAKNGVIQNLDVIASIAETIQIPVEMGGGIRTHENIKDLINAGVSRVILGTRIVDDLEFLKDAISQWGDKIAVSLDCKNGFIATHGWARTTEIKASEFVKELEKLGLACLIYTDIATDGMLTGPNFKELDTMLEATSIPIIASGGVSNIEDIKKLTALETKGLLGAITGKAIYEGTLNLKDALAIC